MSFSTLLEPVCIALWHKSICSMYGDDDPLLVFQTTVRKAGTNNVNKKYPSEWAWVRIPVSVLNFSVTIDLDNYNTLCMRPANERWRYTATPSVRTQNDRCTSLINNPAAVWATAYHANSRYCRQIESAQPSATQGMLHFVNHPGLHNTLRVPVVDQKWGTLNSCQPSLIQHFEAWTILYWSMFLSV